MRTLALSALLVAALTVPALAQTGGFISVYSDNPTFEDCSLTEVPFGLNIVYVVHKWVPNGARAARFAVSYDWIEAIALTVDFMDNTAMGNIYSDVTVIYPACTNGPHLIATLNFVSTIPTLPCLRFFDVVPGAGAASGNIEVTDCNSSCWFATGGRLIVNANSECPCMVGASSALQNPFSPASQCDPVAAEPSTWGSIKALYR